MPLVEPRLELDESREERQQPNIVPALGRRAVHDQSGQRTGLLKVVPAGPADHQRRVAGATGTRYTPTAADAGFRLKLTVTAVNLAGSLTKSTTLTGVVLLLRLPARFTAVTTSRSRNPESAELGV